MKFDGKAVSTSSDLPHIVGATRPGPKVSIQVWRNGSIKKMMVLVDEFPSDEKIASRGNKRGKTLDISNRIGVALRELTNDEKKQLEVNNGLLVEDIRPGIASSVGMRIGNADWRYDSWNQQSRCGYCRSVQSVAQQKQGRP